MSGLLRVMHKADIGYQKDSSVKYVKDKDFGQAPYFLPLKEEIFCIVAKIGNLGPKLSVIERLYCIILHIRLLTHSY